MCAILLAPKREGGPSDCDGGAGGTHIQAIGVKFEMIPMGYEAYKIIKGRRSCLWSVLHGNLHMRVAADQNAEPRSPLLMLMPLASDVKLVPVVELLFLVFFFLFDRTCWYRDSTSELWTCVYSHGGNSIAF